jgi:hypothetical protein
MLDVSMLENDAGLARQNPVRQQPTTCKCCVVLQAFTMRSVHDVHACALLRAPQGDPPPEPAVFQVQSPDQARGVSELEALGLLPPLQQVVAFGGTQGGGVVATVVSGSDVGMGSGSRGEHGDSGGSSGGVYITGGALSSNGEVAASGMVAADVYDVRGGAAVSWRDASAAARTAALLGS